MNHMEFSSTEDEDSDTANTTHFPCDSFKIDWLTIPRETGRPFKLAISALPGCRFRTIWRNLNDDIAAIKRCGITEVFVLLTLGELNKYRVRNLLSAYRESGLVVHHWPFLDGTTLSIEELLHLLQDIKLILECGSKVLIHCYGGLGRACFVAGCLMLDLNKQLSPDEVIQMMRDVRGHGAIQTVKQYNFIHDFRELRDSYLVTTTPRSLSR